MNDNWSTPNDLFAKLNSRYHFTLDAAADESNHKLARYFGSGGEREDALSDPWPTDPYTRIFFNPPYSRGHQMPFVPRAIECAEHGGFAVGLLPADTSTKLFHQIYPRFVTHFLKQRVRFVGAPSAAKFGSMVVEFSEL